MKGKMSHISIIYQENSMVEYCEFSADRPGSFVERLMS